MKHNRKNIFTTLKQITLVLVLLFQLTTVSSEFISNTTVLYEDNYSISLCDFDTPDKNEN